MSGSSATRPDVNRRDRKGEIRRLTQSRLKYISVHVLDYCNSKCKFCVVNSPMRQIPIAAEDLVGFVKSHEGKGYDILNLHGGEPTVSPALFPLLDAGREIGIRDVHLQTNARKLHDRAYVDTLIEKGVTLFVISLHGHNAELQEEISLAPKSFDKIIAGIENCVASGALVRVNSVVCNENYDHLTELWHLVSDLGVPWLNISALHPSEHAQMRFEELVPHPRVHRARMPAILDELRRYAPELYVELEGFATCFVPGYEGYHLKKWNRDIHMKYHDFAINDYEAMMDKQERGKLKSCDGCAHFEQCNGIYRAYVVKDRFEQPYVWPTKSSVVRAAGAT